jgi:predicted SAM-dependent methyltransferase
LNFNELLHDVRTDFLKGLNCAGTFVSAGCAGRWYFDWIRDNVAGVEKHIGIEFYSPKPDDLPDRCEWISDNMTNRWELEPESVDTVFSGQNIEHLWPEMILGFLENSWRVLKPEGQLIIDSPNKRITEAIEWVQPEHLVEFRVDEIVKLLHVMGFAVDSVQGGWLVYDRESWRMLELLPSSFYNSEEIERRRQVALERPEDSFIWWLKARKRRSKPDLEAGAKYVQELWNSCIDDILTRSLGLVGEKTSNLSLRRSTNATESGYMMYGPYLPLKLGSYVLTLPLFVTEDINRSRTTNIVLLDVCSDAGQTIHAQKLVTVDQLDPGWNMIQLPFSLDETVFGVEFRVNKVAGAAVSVACHPILDAVR